MEWFDKAEFSQEERERLAKKGYALPDGSFPIRNGKDLENAIRSVGRAKDYDQARAHIVKRAKELGLVSSLPDEWVGKDKRDKILKSLAILEVGYLAGDVSKDVITSARISANLLEKGGKRAQLGEIREFKGKKYKKTTNGWRPVPKGHSTGESKKTGVSEEKSKQYSEQDIDELMKQVRRGTLPIDFRNWSLADEDGWTIAHQAALFRHLPPDFNQWDLRDKDGDTVAHVAVRYDKLPVDFKDWDLADNEGWTVAHEAALQKRLPKDFNQWDLADEDGWTVAHQAAIYRRLPKDFDQWDLVDKNGHTVADVAGKREY